MACSHGVRVSMLKGIDMFTRRHYKAIAEIIKANSTAEQTSAGNVCNDIAIDLAKYFKKDNSRFNRQKFLDACESDD
jgi:hypothetical protein